MSFENPFPGPSTTGIFPPANGGANEKSPDDTCDVAAAGAGETNAATFEPSATTGAAASPIGAAATGSIPPAKSTTTNTSTAEERTLPMDPPAPNVLTEEGRDCYPPLSFDSPIASEECVEELEQ